jgi:hypothetical protein
LARLEGDRVVIGYAIEKSASIGASARIFAPEVTGIMFRYFDGTAWNASWDAASLQMLPQAIEIVISLRAPGDTSRQPQIHLYRHVIALSTAAAPLNIDTTSSQ